MDSATVKMLHAYLDGELDEQTTYHFERRLANEPQLMTALEEEQAFRTRLRLLSRERAPASLRASVESALLKAEASLVSSHEADKEKGLSGQPSFWQRVVSWLRTPQPIKPVMALHYTLLWVIILGTVTWALSLPAAENHSVFRQLAGKHGVYFESTPPLDVNGQSEQIQDWFKDRVPFTITTPAISGWTLEGARLGEFHHKGTVHLLYSQNNGSATLSLTLFFPRESDFPAETSVILEEHQFFVGTDDQRAAILWRFDEVGYALVASLSAEELLPLALLARSDIP